MKETENFNLRLKDWLIRLTYDLYAQSPKMLKLKLEELEEVFDNEQN